MSKRAEILHKLSTDDRIYLSEKFKEKDQRIADLEAKLAEHNEYFRSFGCENFNEFQDFVSTFMLTPHEEQTLIKELEQRLAEKDKRIHEVENTFNVSAIALAEKFKKIKELKQQLAECNTRIVKEMDLSAERRQIIESLTIENRKLEQQLAEKETEVEKQNRRISLLEKYKNDQKARANDYYKQCKQANQDKILFATRSLEELRNEIYANTRYFKVDTEFYKYVYETISAKINQLEGSKKA